MALDYKDIQKTTKKSTAVTQKQEPLTEKELNRVQYYMEHMEDSIIEIAESGHYKLEYNCNKIPERIFFELAQLFKKNRFENNAYNETALTGIPVLCFLAPAM